ncbi:MAG: hypothetical protein AAF467_18010 [Actinomycetota bacterium]
MSHWLLRAETTLVALARRRLAVGILVMMPIAFYLVTHDSVGRSVRALAFGVSWAVSTIAFFAAVSAREIEPRLWLAGWTRTDLMIGRLIGLGGAVLALTGGFGLLVALDQEVRNEWGVALDYAVTGAVAVAVGTAVGALFDREMEGTLILFFLAGMQAIANPFDAWSRVLPFWSSRELGTWAVDGPETGSLADGLVHASLAIVVCGGIVGLAEIARQRPALRSG